MGTNQKTVSRRPSAASLENVSFLDAIFENPRRVYYVEIKKSQRCLRHSLKTTEREQAGEGNESIFTFLKMSDQTSADLGSDPRKKISAQAHTALKGTLSSLAPPPPPGKSW